jgi:hypothetical protein
MTTTVRNRIDRLQSSRDARCWGEACALHNESIDDCPWPIGSYFWHVAIEAHRNTLTRLAEAHVRDIEAALTTGALAAAEDEADLRDVKADKIGWWERLINWVTGAKV